MKLDVYAPCPGGLDKKVKFCCHDLLTVLDEIQTKLDSDQPHNALQTLEVQLARTPDRPCLLTLQLEALRLTEKNEHWIELATRFQTLHPDNPVACACAASACLARSSPSDSPDELADPESVEERIRQTDELCQQAVSLMQRALSHSEQNLHYQVYEQMFMLPQLLLDRQRFAAAREHLFVAARLTERVDESPALDQLNAFLHSPRVSLLYKYECSYAAYPGDVSWKREFDEAQRLAKRARWQQAFDKLELLRREHGDDLVLLRNLAHLAQVLVKSEKAVELLRRIAELTDDPLEAIEAEALALDTASAVGHYAYPLESHELAFEDGPAALELLLSHSRIVSWEVDPATHQGQEGPPPKSFMIVLDQDRRRSMENQDPSQFARSVATLRYYGKETDRPARLVWTPHDDLSGQLTLTALQGALGTLWREPTRRLVGWDLLAFRLPRRSPVVEHPQQRPFIRQASEGTPSYELLEVWPDVPQPALESLTFREAAGKPEWTRRAQALLCLLESRDPSIRPEQIEMLRSKYGLPNLPTDLAPPALIYDLVPARIARTDFSQTNNQNLTRAYLLAQRLHAGMGIERICQEILRREPHEELVPADLAYYALSSVTPGTQESCELLNKAQLAAIKRGESPAMYKLNELRLRLTRLPEDGPAIQQLIEDLSRKYAKEPGIADGLMTILVQCGIIRPDGRPTRPLSEVVSGSAHTLSSVPGPGDPLESILIGGDSSSMTEPAVEPEKKSSLWLPGQD